MNSYNIINAEERKIFGKSNSKHLKNNHKIPAVIYGSSEKNLHIILNAYEIDKISKKRSFISTPIKITLDNKTTQTVIPHQIQYHNIKNSITHIDFLFLKNDRQTISVPIRYINKTISIGIKRGGKFNSIKREILLNCPIDQIPPIIEIDVKKLKVGESIKASSITIPDNVKLAVKENLILASISGRGKNKDADTEESKEETEGNEATKKE